VPRAACEQRQHRGSREKVYRKRSRTEEACRIGVAMRIDEIRIGLSELRLGPYCLAAGGDVAALRLYAWNIEVSGAFLGLLHVLEVRLRNAVNDQLVGLTGQPDWWTASGLRLTFVAKEAIAKASAEVAKRAEAATAGHMVAELSFGFWVGLFGSGGACQYENRLWRPALHRAFPGYRGPRKPLHRDLNYVRSFRNRIAHHEPIHDRHLAADHRTIFRVLRWMSSDFAAWAAAHDRVPEVLARRADVCAGRADARF
jgi:hypothetical protein